MPRSKHSANATANIVREVDGDHVALGENHSDKKVSPSPRYIRPSLSSTVSYAGPSTDSSGRSTTTTLTSGSSVRGSRVRSRTSTISYTPPLPPVMSRENSLEDVQSHLATSLPSDSGRNASNSVSTFRPNFGAPSRTHSYHSPSASASAAVTPIPSLLASPTDSKNQRIRLKRRISTPTLAPGKAAGKEDAETSDRRRKDDSRTRGRSTSTSIVVPDLIIDSSHTEVPEQYQAGPSTVQHPHHPTRDPGGPSPNTPWAPIFITPASPTGSPPSSSNPRLETYPYAPPSIDADRGILAAVYDFGESSLLRLSRLVRPSTSHHSRRRRGSDEDSEKGLQSEEELSHDSATSNGTSRTSEDSLRRNGKYWGIWQSTEEEDGYFSLPPTPPEEKPEASLADFEAALDRPLGSLPTPALSTRSLSRGMSKKRQLVVDEGAVREGWLATVINAWSNSGTGRRSGGKLGEVIRDLGWTVALLVGLFVATAATVLWMIQAMPITQLKHIPKSTTDLQLLSAEIRAYMASSDVGWYHTVGVLTFVGCWKHAWSVPGAVVLNILVGSLLEPMPALLLLTIITATGSLFSYLLSRPLAPLIAVLFPKPLSLVRAALAPEQVPHPPTATISVADEKVTAIQISSDPATAPIGSEGKTSVWRRLLIMRAMGFVPWSGMNVACGVVNVDWKIFWLTTAAGSASWSYVTASVGNILSRLAIPPGAMESGATGDMIDGESLTSLLRDPVLIAKLVFLSGLTLLPVVLKRRKAAAETAVGEVPASQGLNAPVQSYSPTSPSSPLAKSLARFTPTPAAFDLLSFGRTAVRQGVRVVSGSARNAVGAVRRVVG